MRYYFKEIDTAGTDDTLTMYVSVALMLNLKGEQQGEVKLSRGHKIEDVRKLEIGPYCLQSYHYNDDVFVSIHMDNGKLRSFGARAFGRHIITIKHDSSYAVNGTYSLNKIKDIIATCQMHVQEMINLDPPEIKSVMGPDEVFSMLDGE